jgi:hypothetical protein
VQKRRGETAGEELGWTIWHLAGQARLGGKVKAELLGFLLADLEAEGRDTRAARAAQIKNDHR